MSAQDVAQSLDDVSHKHEKELVIEFGSDRFLHFLGVYLVAFLAAMAKISELSAANLSCYPVSNVTFERGLIPHATSVCWGSATTARVSRQKSGVSACSSEILLAYDEEILEDPSFLKTFIQLFPYCMIFEAVLFAIPSVIWHVRVGPRLMGHIKFIKLLLDNIYKEMETIKCVRYPKQGSYDEKSYYLDGWKGFKPEYRSSKTTQNFNIEEPRCRAENLLPVERSHECPDLKNKDEDNIFTKLIFGKMRDRHIFSMLCFENFSSLEHHPFILSIYKLTSSSNKVQPDKAFGGAKLKGILKLWCNEKNFRGRFLVKWYFLKHVIGTSVAILTLTLSGRILNGIYLEGWNAESFRCDVLSEPNICMLCTILRKLDAMVYLVINISVTLLYLILSISRLLLIRRSDNKAICRYFEEISDASSVALLKVPQRQRD